MAKLTQRASAIVRRMPDPATGDTRSPPGRRFDETMMAMDVVDTIRHADRLVEASWAARNVSSVCANACVRSTSRRASGSDGVLDRGIAALELAYAPRARAGSSLAIAWATRGRWGRFALAGLGVLVIGWGVIASPSWRRAS